MSKSTKDEANYRPRPKGGERCALCDMFRAPNKCTAVEGDISPNAWCKWFERKKP